MAILLARSPIAPLPVIASSETVHLSTRNLLEGLTALVVQSAVSPASAAAEQPREVGEQAAAGPWIASLRSQ